MRKTKKRILPKADNNIAYVWRALGVFTKGPRSTSADVPKTLIGNVFNNHFLPVAESLIESETTIAECFDLCKHKASGRHPFVILNITVSEIDKCNYTEAGKKSSGLDSISNQLLKLSLLYKIDSLTYVYASIFFSFFLHLKKKKKSPFFI